MRSYIRKLIMMCLCSLAVGVVMCGSANAQEQEYQGFKYYYDTDYYFEENKYTDAPTQTVINYGIVLTDYIGKEKEVVIPEKIDGIPVTTIASGCFMGNSDVKKVTVPNTVTAMGRAVFKDCKNLEEVKLPERMDDLPEAAFMNCKKLKSIELPKGCGEIKRNTFYNCSSLQTVISQYEMFGYSMNYIEESAFEGCKKLKNIDLSNTSSIYAWAFKDCKSLKKVNLKYAYIGQEAFKNCTGLVEIEELSFGIYVCEKAFEGCKKLKKINITGFPKKIGKNTFKNIHKNAVFTVQKNYLDKWKKALKKKTGFKQTMKIKTKKNEKY